GIAVSTATNNQQNPAIAWDGINYFVVWQDDRSASNMYDIYGSRVSSAGTVLNTAGIPVCAATGHQALPALAWDGSNYLVVWEDTRSGNFDIYASRVSRAGAILNTGGIAVTTLSNDQLGPAVAWNGVNYLVAWHDVSSGTSNLYGSRLSSAGAVLDTPSIAISTSAALGNEAFPAIAWDGTNYLVVWQNGSDIYGGRVSSAGTVLDTTGIAISTVFGQQSTVDVACDGLNCLVVWQDTRNGNHNRDIYGTSIGVDGTVAVPNGFAIITGLGNQDAPVLAKGGSKFLVSSHSNASGTNRIAAKLVTLTVPAITGFSPSSGTYGAEVTITGANFSGASSVQLNGTSVGASNYRVVSPTEIRFTVPGNATTGKIKVITPEGRAQSTTDFTVLSSVSVAVAGGSILEDSDSSLVYTFTRSAPTGGSLTASFSLAGTAIYATDYAQTGAATYDSATNTGTVFFAANASTATLTLDPVSDLGLEPDETATVALLESSGYVTSGTAATGTIANDDTGLVVTTTVDMVPDGTDNYNTLREAITVANARSGADTVTFSLPEADRLDGKWTIAPTSTLPVVTEAVTLVGAGTLILSGSSAGTDVSGITLDSSGNTITGLCFSGWSGNGIRVLSGNSNNLRSNIFSGNTGISINLVGGIEDSNGVNANDIGDADTGANNLQNSLVLTKARTPQGAAGTTVEGKLHGQTGVTYTIDFYSNSAAHASGYGEGA
ncbi:MAG TPA: IPT/TIG domain-containing protein, partial [Abditibacteriaceae bacterium]